MSRSNSNDCESKTHRPEALSCPSQPWISNSKDSNTLGNDNYDYDYDCDYDYDFEVEIDDDEDEEEDGKTN